MAPRTKPGSRRKPGSSNNSGGTTKYNLYDAEKLAAALIGSIDGKTTAQAVRAYDSEHPDKLGKFAIIADSAIKTGDVEAETVRKSKVNFG